MNLNQIIKNHNLIIITGPLGSGKSLGLTQQAQHSQWQGQVLNAFSIEQVNQLDQAKVIYLDGLNNHLNEPKNQFISNYLAKTEKKVFVSCHRIGSLPLQIREKHPLLVLAQGLKKQGNGLRRKGEYYLELEYSQAAAGKTGQQTKLPITPQDFKFLAQHNHTVREHCLNMRKHINNHRDPVNP